MKHVTLSLIVICSFIFGELKGQEYSNYNHDFSISYGYYTKEAANIDGRINWPGAINVQYLYPITDNFSMGALAVYSMSSYTVDFGYGYSADLNDYYFTFMPVIKYNYYYNKYSALYSKAAIGFSNQIKSSSSYDEENNGMKMGYQISILGFEFGAPSVRCFIEGGYGSQGVIQAGLKVCLF